MSGLTDAEREAIKDAANVDSRRFSGSHPDYLRALTAVERIVADREAALREELDKALTVYAEREQRWHWSLIREQNAEARAEKAEAQVQRVRELADPDYPPPPPPDERGAAGWRFAMEHIRAALDGSAS